jgi:hypothetical protein
MDKEEQDISRRNRYFQRFPWIGDVVYVEQSWLLGITIYKDVNERLVFFLLLVLMMRTICFKYSNIVIIHKIMDQEQSSDLRSSSIQSYCQLSLSLEWNNVVAFNYDQTIMSASSSAIAVPQYVSWRWPFISAIISEAYTSHSMTRSSSVAFYWLDLALQHSILRP